MLKDLQHRGGGRSRSCIRACNEQIDALCHLFCWRQRAKAIENDVMRLLLARVFLPIPDGLECVLRARRSCMVSLKRALRVLAMRRMTVSGTDKVEARLHTSSRSIKPPISGFRKRKMSVGMMFARCLIHGFSFMMYTLWEPRDRASVKPEPKSS